MSSEGRTGDGKDGLNHELLSQRPVKALSDDELVSLSVYDLNRQLNLRCLTVDEVTQIKKRRRTLKNRSYAASCRVRRINRECKLEMEKSHGLGEMMLMQEENKRMRQEIQSLRSKYIAVKKFAALSSFSRQSDDAINLTIKEENQWDERSHNHATFSAPECSSPVDVKCEFQIHSDPENEEFIVPDLCPTIAMEPKLEIHLEDVNETQFVDCGIMTEEDDFHGEPTGNGTEDSCEPSTSRAETRKIIFTTDLGRCLFCKLVFLTTERVPNITEKGLISLIAVCQARKDYFARIIIQASKEGYQNFPYKYHNSCREQYANRKNMDIAKKRKLKSYLNRCQTPPPTKLVSHLTKPEFDWNIHCFICHQIRDKKKSGRKFSLVNKKPESLRENVLKAAIERNDKVILNRMACDSIFELNARYHGDCLSKYLSAKNIEACKKAQIVLKYDRAAVKTLEFFSDEIIVGKIILIPNVCTKYREFLVSEGVDDEVASACDLKVIRNKLISNSKDQTVSFHYQTEKLPGIMCSDSLSVGQFYQQMCENKTVAEQANIITEELSERLEP